ncbi:MAG: AMP-binding protein [Actinomycetota bacterium]|jgi:long-chain acyl-CoA synthetase|nr:AMP-binding protein [Actinomycetota bacterium]
MSCDNFADYVAKLGTHKNRVAVIKRPFIKTERLSFRELQDGARQTANFLRAAGVVDGDRVMVVADNSPEWIELFLGTQLIGAILVPVDVGSSLQVVLRYVADTEPKLIFRSRSRHSELSELFRTYLMETLHEAISEFPRSSPGSPPAADPAALIVFTSGTTAAPKGVLLTQKNLLSNVSGILDRIKISADWRLLSVLPLSHMYELTGSLAALSSGACIFYPPRVTPSSIAAALSDYQITTMLAIPQLLVLMLERIERTVGEKHLGGAYLAASKIAGHLPFWLRRLLFISVHSRLGGKLDLVVTGGAPMPVEVANAWEAMGVRIVQGYGLTETSPILTVNGLTHRRMDSPGKALFNVELRIDEEREIQARGPNVFGGYWRDPTATQAAFTSDGWFRTGDVGEMREGWLYIRGRLKSAIVLSSGLKVFPEDIELVSSRSPTLSSMCVVGERRPEGEAVVAVVSSERPDQEITAAIAEVNAQLESYQHVSSWRRWPYHDFPRTRLLKIDRRKVQDWLNANLPEAPETPKEEVVEDSLVRMIRLSLGDSHSQFGESDRLSDIGLDSLRRLTLGALIEENLGITVAEEMITESTTVSELRKALNEGGRVEVQLTLPRWPFNPWVRTVGNGVREVLVRGLLRIWVEMRVEGMERLKDLRRPAIFIFNHTDDFDGPVIYQAMPHRIRKRLTVAAADDVLREHKFLAFIIRFCFAGFNLSRKEPYMPSLEYVGQMMDAGWSVVLSPEGSLSKTGELQPFKSGIGLLAVELGVPIVPLKTVGLSGTVPLHAKWPKKHSKVVVHVGPPVTFGPKERYDEVASRLHQIMEML